MAKQEEKNGEVWGNRRGKGIREGMERRKGVTSAGHEGISPLQPISKLCSKHKKQLPDSEN